MLIRKLDPLSRDDLRAVEMCCVHMHAAFGDGTDNEAYESLARFDIGADGSVLVHIGSGLPPVRVCPWCGASVADIRAVEEQA